MPHKHEMPPLIKIEKIPAKITPTNQTPTQKTGDAVLCETTLSKKQKRILISLTLFIHVAGLFVLFCLQTENSELHELFRQLANNQKLLEEQNKKNNTPDQNTPEKPEEWGAVKARASRFGAPVIFQEEPEFTLPPDKAVAQTPEKKHEPHKAALLQAPPKNGQVSTTETNSLEPESLPRKQEEITLALQKEPMKTVAEATTQTADTKKLTPEPENGTATKEQIPESESGTTKIEQINNTPNHDFGWGKKDAAPVTKKMVSLAHLARGFLDNMKNEGPHAVTMIGGKEGGRITTEQLKFERYVQRLNWCLQNSLRINRSRNHRNQPNTTAEVHLVLDRNGRIKDVQILKSSGDQLLDDHTLFVFNDAGSSFPPVPQYLPQDPFTITYVVEYGLANGPPQRPH